jgi:hypothetical protein
MSDAPEAPPKRTPPRTKARQLARSLRGEHPDYNYLKQVFRHLRAELEITIPTGRSASPMSPVRTRCATTIRPCGTPATSLIWC